MTDEPSDLAKVLAVTHAMGGEATYLYVLVWQDKDGNAITWPCLTEGRMLAEARRQMKQDHPGLSEDQLDALMDGIHAGRTVDVLNATYHYRLDELLV